MNGLSLEPRVGIVGNLARTWVSRFWNLAWIPIIPRNFRSKFIFNPCLFRFCFRLIISDFHCSHQPLKSEICAFIFYVFWNFKHTLYIKKLKFSNLNPECTVLDQNYWWLTLLLQKLKTVQNKFQNRSKISVHKISDPQLSHEFFFPFLTLAKILGLSLKFWGVHEDAQTEIFYRSRSGFCWINRVFLCFQITQRKFPIQFWSSYARRS